MERGGDFKLEDAINEWEKNNFLYPGLMPSDKAEITDHFILTIKELKNSGLSDEKAFLTAKERYGDIADWGEDMSSMNEDNFQLRKIILLLSGVFAFVFFNNLVLCLDKLIVIGLSSFNVGVEKSIGVVSFFIKTVYLLSIFTFISLYFLHGPVINILKRLKLKVKLGVFFIIALLFIVVLEWFLSVQIKPFLNDNVCLSQFYFMERNFNYFFLLIGSIGYSVLISKYHKKFHV